MNIENHLSQLLYRYQCVTVPGFGAFLTEMQSAQINESASSFYPPKKIISFSSYIKNNDGLLANHISSIEKIDYAEALLKIKNQVLAWEDKLSSLGLLALKNIGDFKLNAENKLVFFPSNQINYLPESFGLSNFNSATISRVAVFKTEQKVVELVSDVESVQVKEANNDTLVKTIDIEKEVVYETSINEEEIKIKQHSIPEIPIPIERTSFSFLKYAAIFAIGFGVTGFFANEYYNKKIASDTLIVQKKVQKEVNKKIQEATFSISIPTTSLSLNVASESKPFHLVASAFRKELNANKELKSLLKQGFDAKRMAINKSGLFPVVYSSFATYAEAQQEMIKIHKTINKEAWILIEENK